MRPENPIELDHVDWRGRWIESDDDYEDEEEDEEDGPMEDFDPDAIGDDDDDDDEEEEEEEEEDNVTAQGAPTVVAPGRRHQAEAANINLRPPTPINPPAPSSPRASAMGSPAAGLKAPRDQSMTVSRGMFANSSPKVKVVRTVATEKWARAMQT